MVHAEVCVYMLEQNSMRLRLLLFGSPLCCCDVWSGRTVKSLPLDTLTLNRPLRRQSNLQRKSRKRGQACCDACFEIFVSLCKNVINQNWFSHQESSTGPKCSDSSSSFPPPSSSTKVRLCMPACVWYFLRHRLELFHISLQPQT